MPMNTQGLGSVDSTWHRNEQKAGGTPLATVDEPREAVGVEHERQAVRAATGLGRRGRVVVEVRVREREDRDGRLLALEAVDGANTHALRHMRLNSAHL